MEKIKRYGLCIVGCVLMAIAINGFIVPHDFVSAGFSGLAIAFGKVVNIPTGVLIILLNIPLFAWAYKKEGRTFVVDGLITIVILGLCVDLFQWIPQLSNDPLLSALVGGVIDGAGVGICYKAKMTSGGTDLLARLLLYKFRWMTPGKMMNYISIFIILIGTFIVGQFHLIFYSIIEFYICNHVSDKVIIGGNHAKTCQIITTKAEQIATAIMQACDRGVTLNEAMGAYSKQPKHIVMCVVSLKQVNIVIDIVKEIDPDAFVMINDVSQVLGNGFNCLKSVD